MKRYPSLFAAFMSKTVALAIVATLLVSTLVFSVGAQQMSAQKSRSASLNQEQRILHVLNRLGFGARPGDVERVKAIGLDSYINQQLNPGGISDSVLEAKLQDRNLSTLTMTTAQLLEKYPKPGDPVMTAQDSKSTESMPNSPALPANNPLANNPNELNPNPQDNEAYRKAIRDFYQQNGLQPPARILSELQAARMLRAVYSERQLQEVMVDFWTNHFNVFAGKGVDRYMLTAYDRDTIRPNSMGK